MEGKDPLLDKLKRLADLGGTKTDDLSKVRGSGKSQSRLMKTFNMLRANDIQSKLLLGNLGPHWDGRDNPHFRQFISQRGPTSMRFLNRSHLSNKARGFRAVELKLVMMLRLMISLVPVNKFTCTRCNTPDVHITEHLECCTKMHVRTTITNGEPLRAGEVRYVATNGRAPDLHKELKRVLKDHLRRIPDVCVHGPEPFPDRFFNLNQDRINIDQIDNVVRRNGGIHDVEPTK